VGNPTQKFTNQISGCDVPTERLSAFVDKLLQPIAKEQEFINFIDKNESTRERYSCFNGRHKPIHRSEAYESYYEGQPPTQHNILKERFNLYFKKLIPVYWKKNHLQTHGTAMGTKMAVAFANIFMGKVESQIFNQSAQKPLAWKRYIDDLYSIWNINKGEVTQFIPLSNLRLKFPIRKHRSSTQKFTKAKDLHYSLD